MSKFISVASFLVLCASMPAFSADYCRPPTLMRIENVPVCGEVSPILVVPATPKVKKVRKNIPELKPLKPEYDRNIQNTQVTNVTIAPEQQLKIVERVKLIEDTRFHWGLGVVLGTSRTKIDYNAWKICPEFDIGGQVLVKKEVFFGTGTLTKNGNALVGIGIILN